MSLLLSNSQESQESILSDIFQQLARYGDAVNAKNNVESLGREFGLAKLYVCSEGKDLFGGLQDVTCPKTIRTHDLTLIDRKIELIFQWSPKSASVDPLIFKAISMTSILSLFAVFVASTLVYLILRTRIKDLSDRILVSAEPQQTSPLNSPISELQPIANAIFEMRRTLVQSNERISELKTSEALGKLARQVAHDIRSPLSALALLKAKQKFLDDESASLASSAIVRIAGIADDLLKFQTQPSQQSMILSKPIVRSFVELKRVEYPALAIDLEISELIDCTLPLSEDTLFRILSNTINNSVEAFGDRAGGHILIKITTVNQRCEFLIVDNGPGVSDLVAAKIQNHPESEGKQDSQTSGFGLGLSYARTVMNSIGGEWSFKSKMGYGTTVGYLIPVLNSDTTNYQPF